MYKINDYVEYKQPIRIKEKGKIITKLKIIDGDDSVKGAIVYSICYDERCYSDLVFEEDIIGLVDK